MTESLGQVLARATTDLIDAIATWTAQQVTAAVTPHPPTGEPVAQLVTADRLDAIMVELGLPTADMSMPMFEALAENINALHSQAMLAVEVADLVCTSCGKPMPPRQNCSHCKPPATSTPPTRDQTSTTALTTERRWSGDQAGHINRFGFQRGFPASPRA
jgi:hypothetical protein